MGEDNERRRRKVAAQGFAAVAVFMFAHGAHAATVPAQAGHPGRGSATVQHTRVWNLARTGLRAADGRSISAF
jgi:hypothetical protein